MVNVSNMLVYYQYNHEIPLAQETVVYYEIENPI